MLKVINFGCLAGDLNEKTSQMLALPNIGNTKTCQILATLCFIDKKKLGNPPISGQYANFWHQTNYALGVHVLESFAVSVTDSMV